QAVVAAALLFTAGHHLRHHIEATGIEITRGMGVVAADVVLLGIGIAQQAAGMKEKLADRDIGRQAVTAQILQILEFLVIPVNALNKRLQEAPLKLAAANRP